MQPLEFDRSRFLAGLNAGRATPQDIAVATADAAVNSLVMQLGAWRTVTLILTLLDSMLDQEQRNQIISWLSHDSRSMH